MDYGYISSKWSALFVAGPRLTEQQTNEVMVRMTDPYWLMGNDPEWERLTHEAFGMTVTDRHGLENWQAYDAECKRVYRDLGTVHTEYLGLAGRVYSAMIGGSYGWLDWDGVIASVYNVGKWPTVEELTEQWSDIAAAFPFLKLTAQAFDLEVIEMQDNELPCAQWTIADGVATLDVEPSLMLDIKNRGLDGPEQWNAWFSSGMRERHVPLERLQAAIAQVRSTYIPEDDSVDEHGE